MAELALEPQQGSLFEQAAPRTPSHYYWGGQANPHLRDFVKSCLDDASFDPEPEMSVTEPLLVSSTVKRSTKIFNMHSYWSKKPHDSIKGFIQHFSREGDLVLDPFCGSGGTLLMAALGRRSAIGIDLSPAATYLSAALCAPPDIATFERQFQGIMGKLRSEYGWLYRLPFRGSMRDIHFGISSMVFECMRCLDRSSLYRAKDYGEGACCPKCGEPIKTTQQKYGYQLDEWHLLAERGSHDIYTVNNTFAKSK